MAHSVGQVLLDAGKSSAQFRQQVLSACKRDLEHSEVRVRSAFTGYLFVYTYLCICRRYELLSV